MDKLKNYFKNHFDKFIKQERLTKIIKRERRRLYRFSTRGFFRSLFSEVYIPSFKSFFLILFFSIILFLIAHLDKILVWLHLFDKLSFLDLETLSKESNHYQNLISIHAGIGTIIFALVIFVAESMRDDEAKDRARVLLKESYLFPLAVAEIAVFFIFVWGDINIWSIIPVGVIGLFTILSLRRMIAVLLSKYRFAQKRASLLKERLQQSIDLAIDERIGNNTLLSKLHDEDIKLEFYPFPLDNQTEYYCVNAEKFGLISDVDLKALRAVADLIDEEARKNGFSFGGEEKPEVNVSEEGEIRESASKTLPKNNRRYLMKKFHDVVDEEDQVLICVDKKLLKNGRMLKELDNLVKSTFTIEPADNFAKEVRYEISGVKDQFTAAIASKQFGKIEELVDLYIKLAEGFLEHIAKCGSSYSAEQARKERLSLFAGWEQVRWLSSDIKELFEKSMQSNDREIITNVAYLPMAIARRAIDKNDHYLFQEFIWFAELLYTFAFAIKEKNTRKNTDKNNALKNFLVDRSWRYLKEISDVYVEAKLRKETLEQNELKSLRDFGIYFFTIFQNLLKKSFINKDVESFAVFLQTTQKLFAHFTPGESTQNAKDIKWRIEKIDTISEQQDELETLLEQQLELEEVAEEIKIRKNQMLFGLTSWIFGEYLYYKNRTVNVGNVTSNNINNNVDIENIITNTSNPDNAMNVNNDADTKNADDVSNVHNISSKIDTCNDTYNTQNIIAKQFYDLIQNVFPKEIAEFTDIFLKTCDFDVEDFWGWNLWQKRKSEEEKSEQFSGKLERFYAVKALTLLTNKTNEEIKKIELLHSNDLGCLADNIDELVKIFDDINANPNVWKFVLTDAAINKIEPFKNLLYRTIETQEREEIQKKREQKISAKKVQEFKDSVTQEFYEFAILRDVFQHYDLLENKLDEAGENKKNRFGINIVEDKATFFENWHIDFDDWGSNYGRDLAYGEDSYLFDMIAKNCKEVAQEQFERILTTFTNVEDIVILTTNIAVWQYFEDSKNFTPKWHKDIKQLEIMGFSGWYNFSEQDIPIFEIHHSTIENQVLILNHNTLGKLIQLSPLNKGENENLIKDIFYMDIQAFAENQNLMEQFVKKPPMWLRKVGDEQKQREHLQERVRIQIFERLDYNKPENFEGYKLLFKRT